MHPEAYLIPAAYVQMFQSVMVTPKQGISDRA
jgi:hypothetical protein